MVYTAGPYNYIAFLANLYDFDRLNFSGGQVMKTVMRNKITTVI